MKISDWINVKDKLPKLNERVLVCQIFNDGSKFVRSATIVKINDKIRFYNDDGFAIDYITHWQRIVLP
jgi:hypothetical protein